MPLKIIIAGKDDALRDSLAQFVKILGHSVVETTAPETCPFYHSENAFCVQETSCGDALILIQNLPAVKGIDFIRRRIEGGCKGAAKKNALIFGPWSEEEKKIADTLNCHFFETPLDLSDIESWLNEIVVNQ